MKIKAGKIELRLSLFFFIMPVLAVLLGLIREYAAAFLSISIHEFAHMALARSYGCRCDGISILPIGLSASINCGGCHDKKLIPVYLAGPAANMLIFASIKAIMMAMGADGDNLRLVCQTNLYLALFNMIPAYPLDGGRILMAALAGRMGLISAGRLIRRIALAASIGIVLWGALDSPASVGGASLVMIGIFMISAIKKSRTECAFMNIKQILYRRTKLLRRGIYQARELVVMKNTMLSAAINYMDHDSFHLISVLDDNFSLIGICTENDIMEAMTDENAGMTFEQLLNKQKEKDCNRQQ